LGRDRAELPLAERVAQVIAAYPLVVAQMGGAPIRIDARYPNGLAASSPLKANKSDRTARP
ncbi:MAG: cell division protein FtsQ/DivIB, partial [Burkholderiaceae bacterium]